MHCTFCWYRGCACMYICDMRWEPVVSQVIEANVAPLTAMNSTRSSKHCRPTSPSTSEVARRRTNCLSARIFLFSSYRYTIFSPEVLPLTPPSLSQDIEPPSHDVRPGERPSRVGYGPQLHGRPAGGVLRVRGWSADPAGTRRRRQSHQGRAGQ